MTRFKRQIRRSGIRLRLVVSLPLLIVLVGLALAIIAYKKSTVVLQERAWNYHVALAQDLATSAEREAARTDEELFGALGTQIGYHERSHPEGTVRFILFRAPPAGELLTFDPMGQVTLYDQTDLLALTNELGTPRVMRIGLENELHLVSAHRAVENGYYLIALEPFRNIRELGRWIIWMAILATGFTVIGLAAVAWFTTAPLHRIAEKIRELARNEILDPREVEAIIEKAQEPEEVATLVLALEQALNSLVNLKRSVHGIIESMEGGILATDGSGRLEHINTAARDMLGLEGSLIGRDLRSIIPSPEENTAFGNIVNDLFERRVTYGRPRELQVRNGRGETVDLGVATSLVPDPQGEVLSGIVVMIDVGEIIELRERVRKADRMSSLGSMATKVAHEIRNPLGSVKGLAQLVLESAHSAEDVHDYAERIVREVDRLSNIVAELLDYSQRKPLTLEAVDLNELVHETLEVARFREGARNPTLLQELDLELPRVRMDRNRFMQALLNIILNALQAVGPDGAVTLSTYTEETVRGENIVLEVSDNGPGIPPDVLEHVFDPFYTTKDQGSGLGLAIAFTIVREHHGILEVSSKVGQGATFRIVLPRNRHANGEGS